MDGRLGGGGGCYLVGILVLAGTSSRTGGGGFVMRRRQGSRRELVPSGESFCLVREAVNKSWAMCFACSDMGALGFLWGVLAAYRTLITG